MAIVINRKVACSSIQKKFALITKKLEFAQKSTAEKDIPKPVDIFKEDSVEETHLANIYILNKTNPKNATNVTRMINTLIIVSFVLKLFVPSVQLKRHMSKTFTRIMRK